MFFPRASTAAFLQQLVKFLPCATGAGDSCCGALEDLAGNRATAQFPKCVRVRLIVCTSVRSFVRALRAILTCARPAPSPRDLIGPPSPPLPHTYSCLCQPDILSELTSAAGVLGSSPAAAAILGGAAAPGLITSRLASCAASPNHDIEYAGSAAPARCPAPLPPGLT